MKRHIPQLLGFCVVYGFVNYGATKYLRDGKPLYSFINWRDRKTFVYIGLMLPISIMVFCTTAAIEQRVKNRWIY